MRGGCDGGEYEIVKRVAEGCSVVVARSFRERRGWGLFDNLWSLGIAAAVVIVVISFGLLAQTAFREYRATSLLMQLVQGVTTTYQSTRNYGGESVSLLTTLCKFQRIPADFAVDMDDCSAVTVEHPFGGKVTVKGGHDSESNRFKIEFEDLEVGGVRGPCREERGEVSRPDGARERNRQRRRDCPALFSGRDRGGL